MFISNMLLQLSTTSRIITAATNCCDFVFQGFLPPKLFRGLLTQRFWYPFKLFYCLIGFYMRRRLFLEQYTKKHVTSENTTVNIYYFHILTFCISQQQGILQKLKSSREYCKVKIILHCGTV